MILTLDWAIRGFLLIFARGRKMVLGPAYQRETRKIKRNAEVTRSSWTACKTLQ